MKGTVWSLILTLQRRKDALRGKMTENPFPFQPGAMLHDAIVGAFRATGGSFEVWCTENGIAPAIARNATFGVGRGPKGRALLARLIAAANPDVVRAGYLARLKSHTEDLRKGVA